MTAVVVIIYNRYENLKKWVECWQKCDKTNADLIVIHNLNSHLDSIRFKNYCADNGVKYIPRPNVGFDIGAFQDVCTGRINIGDWENLLWCTDDTLPMDRHFVSRFTNKLDSKTGVVCMEISEEVTTHIRTTGFCLSKETAKRIKFATPNLNKIEYCYDFEHHAGELTFYRQILRMGLDVKQVAPLETSPLWDTGHRAYLKRNPEMINEFYGDKKVTFIAPIYQSFPEIVSSLICQTYKNWELILIHDGPNTTGLRQYIEAVNDKRIVYIETKERVNKWGHPYRAWALNEIKNNGLSANCDYITISNADNYHMPTYCETMIRGFKDGIQAVYCSHFVHSYMSNQKQENGQILTYPFGIINTRLELGYIDCACVMVRKEAACEVGWRDVDSHSSDWTYFSDILAKFGAHSFNRVMGCLLSHN